jgi:hypothetical protein
MKRAVIVVGPHFSGKSKTINKYFKPLVGISGNQRTFDLREKPGVVLSQSLEEKRLGRVLSQSSEEKSVTGVGEFLSRYLWCQWLVLAARPSTEPGSHLEEILRILKGNGFSVLVVEVAKDQPESFYRQRANEILARLLQPHAVGVLPNP